MKTEFKDVAKHYLGTGLMIKSKRPFDNEASPIESVATIKGDSFIGEFVLTTSKYEFDSWDQLSPLMHSLDKITEPITVDGYNDGKEFVAEDELYSLYFNQKGSMDLDFDVIIHYLKNGRINLVPFYIVNQLIQWHFNVFNVDCIDK